MALIIATTKIQAQIINNNAFLKGNYVEVGMAPCGSFGSSVNAPAGYHPRGVGSQLGFVANVAKNNWATFVGDYFLPGTPEEGWGITVNGRDFNNSLICTPRPLFPNDSSIQGNIIAYKSTAAEVSATWLGGAAGLSITSRTYIPINSLYFITEVTIQNTSSTAINNIFYMRNVDPDHGLATPGGGNTYSTNNTIVFQTPNACNQALVSAVTTAGNHYLGLGSIDSRARVTMGGFLIEVLKRFGVVLQAAQMILKGCMRQGQGQRIGQFRYLLMLVHWHLIKVQNWLMPIYWTPPS